MLRYIRESLLHSRRKKSWVNYEGSLVLGFPSISPTVVVAGVGTLSGKGPQLSCLRTWITFSGRKLIPRWPVEASCGWSTSILLYSGCGPYNTRLKIDLFVFIRHSDPTKLWIRESELAKREVGLLKMTKGCTVPLSLPATTAPEESGDSIEKLFDVVDQEHVVEKSDDVLEVTIAKVALKVVTEKARKYRRESLLLPFWGMVSNGYAIPRGATEPLVAASVAPILDVGPLDFVFGPNLRTCPPHVRYVVSSDGSCHLGSYSETNSFVRSPAVDAPVVTVNVTTAVDADVGVGSKAKNVSNDFENIRDSTSTGGVNADAASVSRLKKTSTSSDSSYASQSLDTKTMHRVYIPRWKVTNDSTLDDPYVFRNLTDRLAPPVLFAQLCAMDYDQVYYEFNVGAARQIEAAEAISLQSQLFVIETADAAKSIKLRDLKEENFALEGEISALFERKSSIEYAFELFRKHIEALQDKQVKDLGDKIAELDAQLSQMAIHLNEEFYRSRRAIGCAVNKGIQDGLKAGIDHGKFRRDLSVVEAYDPFAKEKYVDGFWKEAKEKRLSLTDVMTPFIEHFSSKCLTVEASTFATPSLPFQQPLPPLPSSLLA
nr:hypothetical protein [Tanacetum cinerariifolium]